MAMLGGECSACCGGACSECAPSHVSITIASNDFLRHSEWRSMYGQTYKDSWGIIASPLSGTFRLSLARCSTPFGFPNAYEFVYESDEISYPGSGKIVAKFFNEPGVVARHLFTIEVPVTVCRGLNYKSYDPNNYKFYSLTEMLTPQREVFVGSTLVSVSAGVGKTSTTFVCSGQAGSSRSYVAVGGVNAYDGQANDAAEGASPPCVVWSFDPTSTDAITVPNAQGYGYLRHYQPNMYGWTELSRSDVTTGQNAVTVSSVEFDCNSLQKGACCEGATCSVKPQCQCQGAGKVFKGVGTVCEPNPCLSCCTFLDWNTGGPLCLPVMASNECLAQNNKKLSSCSALQTSVSVSGFGELVGVEGQCSPGYVDAIAAGSDKSLAVANGTLSSQESCGGSIVSVYKRDLYFSAQDVGTTLYVIWSFSPRSASGQQCSQGLVRFKVQVNIERTYPLGFGSNIVRMNGSYESECIAIESLPSSGLLSAGRSAQVTLSGSINNWCVLEPQTVAVSLAGNPLP